MKFTTPLLIASFLITANSLVFAQSITINTAKKIAQNHLLSVGQNKLKSASPIQPKFQFSSHSVTSESKDTLYFVLNDTINHSFVIVAADKRSTPIIGYSLEGSYNENNQPPAFVAWMENRKKEIESIKQNNLQSDSKISLQWNKLSSSNYDNTETTTSVEPLLKTQWDQGCYYNQMCPSDAQSPYCGHVPTGCVATAMAQIMKYWNYPTKGTGSNSYLSSIYGKLMADFGSTTYQWNQMPNSVTSPNDAVATLMYHCGVSLNMGYSTYISSAWGPRDALVQFFNYSSKAMQVSRSGFATSEWISLLKSELDLRHPIWYMGYSPVGHAFICDGYQNADYFHFNWGGSGSSDGYFYIGNLNPGGGNGFNENQSAVINIVPGNLPDGYNGFFLSSNALDIATTGGTASVDICSSANWTASSDQSWLSLSTNTGVPGKTTLTFTATENQTGSDRSAKVTISAVGFGSQTITVNQLTKVNVTPGNLYNLFANKASRITHLTLSGTIDARDFKTLRDAMPALTTVDMSEVTIVAYTGNEGPSNFEYKTYPANEIPYFAFSQDFNRGKIYLEEFIFPKSIKSIGSYSFSSCSYLTKINILASVINIEALAFMACNALIDVDKANPNYSSIDGVLFDKNQTSLISCPTSKTGNYTIPSSVTSIKNYAFMSCGKLSSINIPTSVTSMEEFAFFYYCNASFVVEKNNLNYSTLDGVLFNKEQTVLIRCPISKTGNYVIPSSVISIGRIAFDGCYGLLTVTIPSSVTSIENSAFSCYSGMTLFSIPSSVTSIGSDAFFSCWGLTTVTIPSSVISIGSEAFLGCRKLTNLTIPSSVKTIETRAFASCDSLRSIFAYPVIPIDLNSSLDVFFEINKNTCTLYVPYGSRPAYQKANQWKDFINIVEMPGIFLSNNKISIGPEVSTVGVAISSSSAWTAASDHTWLTTKSTAGTFGTDTIVFTANENPTSAIRSATITIFATGMTPQTIEVTQYGRFEVTAGNLKTILANQLSTITSLTLSGTIDARDFKTMRDEMPALTDIDLSGVTIAAYSGTGGTDRINGIYAANCIPSCAFFNYDTGIAKTVLRSVVLPLSVTSIGSFAFCCCTNLNSINIPSSVISIELLAFYSCTGLSTINIPASVNLIDKTAFDSFSALITVDGNNLTYSAIDGVLFNKNRTELIKCPVSKTGHYSIPSSVTSIQYNAFESCKGLTNLTIPSSLKTIGTRAFAFCESLRSIFAYPVIPIDLNSSLDVFFEINKNTCTLYVPYGSRPAYQKANQWKDFTNIVELPNQAPVASAGTDQTINTGKLVTLNGNGSSDAEGNSLTYKWTSPAGITLNATTVSNPTFTAPDILTNTNFTFSLIVNDGVLDSPADQVVVTVTPNKAPTANAGTDQTVNENSLCTLDGSVSSDPDKDALTYLWIAPSGITLSSNTAPKPTFTTPEVTTDTNYTFSLVVKDGSLNSTADQIVVTVKQINKAPVANAGPDQTVNEKILVSLTGAGSIDADGNPLAYQWTAPEGITISSNTASKPTFTAPEVSIDTKYTFSLVVNDGFLNSTADPVIITVKNVDKAPYLKNPISNISVDKRAPDQVIDLKTVFADDDLGDVLSYSVTLNTNNQVVTTKITGSNLTLSFSTLNTGLSEIEVTANSNGKVVITKFNVEVKIPTGIDPLVRNQKLTVFPNPTNGKIKIVFDQIPRGGTELIVTDITGRTILKQIIQENEEWIDITGYSPGIFLFKTNLDDSTVQKVVLK